MVECGGIVSPKGRLLPEAPAAHSLECVIDLGGISATCKPRAARGENFGIGHSLLKLHIGRFWEAW